MAKNLKLNIKNLQIAKTLEKLGNKGKPAAKKSKKKVQKEEVEKEKEKPQRTVRILPSLSEEKKKKELEKEAK